MNRLLIALIVLLPGVLRAADAAASAATEPPTQLSPYEVRANSVEFNRWMKVGSPHFIVYTDASASDAARVLREFEMLHFAGQLVFGRRAANFGPTILILPTASSDWRKLEEKGSGVEWKAAVASVGGDVVDVVVAQYDWQNQGLGLVRAMCAHIDQRRMDIPAPFWFSEGLGCFYETAEFDGDKLKLGHINPRVFYLKEHNWLSWERFFQVSPSSPEFTKISNVDQYVGQAALFTQYLFANSDRAWLGRLVAWKDYLQTGAPPTEGQFKAIFGQDWRKWQGTMEDYLSSGSYNVFQVRVPPQITHFTETKYKLPVKEMRELFILGQTLLQKVPDSKTSLDALLAKGLQSEPLREMLVESCLNWKRRDAALENVRRLIAAGSTNPRVYRQGDALLTSYAGRFSLDLRYGPELAEVRDWDRRGLELEPLYTDLNNSFAGNEAGAPVVDQQSITTIEACYERLKGRAPTDEVITVLAMALWRSGDTKTAKSLATKLRDDPLVAKRWRDVATALVDRINSTAQAAAG